MNLFASVTAQGLFLQPEEASIVEEARDLLKLIPPHNSTPSNFAVAAWHHMVIFGGVDIDAFHVMPLQRIGILRRKFNL